MDVIIALYILMLTSVVGFVFSSKSPLKLRTPLLSTSCFINGIVLVGAMIFMGSAETTLQIIGGFITVALAAANAVGGFILTSNMMNVFSKNKAGDK